MSGGPATGVPALSGPGPAAVCPGTVMHHRHQPVDHRFTYPVSLLWLDPENPGELDGRHPLCSTRHPAPLRFRRADYLDGRTTPLGPAVRTRLAEALGHWPDGPLRMLTQPRTWGWLFNPITIYLAWEVDGTGPVAALLEVTNTPWKERHLYPVALHPSAPTGAETIDGTASSAWEAGFSKVLHVSPFLDEDFRYRLGLRFSCPSGGHTRRLRVDLDVVPRIQADPADGVPGEADPGPPPVLTTRLAVDLHPLEGAMLSQLLRRNPFATHRVSYGIHRQALSLWRRGVPFVSHPRRRPAPALVTVPVNTRGRGRGRRGGRA